jgi:hypothetical protein
MTEDFVDSVLRCGLYLGAIFQLICIAAAVVMPDKIGDSNSSYCKVMIVFVPKISIIHLGHTFDSTCEGKFERYNIIAIDNYLIYSE